MKRIITLAFLICFLIPLTAQNKEADRIVGKWYTENNKSVVEIYKKGNKYYGKLVWLKNPTNPDGTKKIDDKNPDVKLQSRPLVGLLLMSGLEYDGDDEWDEGDIYDPESGSTYSCMIEMNNPDKIEMTGYIGFSFIGRSTVWVRKKD